MMNKTYSLQGDINQRGQYDISQSRSLKDVLQHEAGGMLAHKRVKMVQVGGPLGKCLSGEQLNASLEDIKETELAPSIYFFNDVFCPVDYMRFLIRYMIREVKLDTDRMRKIYAHIENIEQGTGTMADLVAIQDSIGVEGKTKADKLFNSVFSSVIEKFQPEILEHVEKRKCRNGICRGLTTSQCINACPANINIPGYVELMKRDQHKEAYALMRQENPLSFICGKICARPCEERCRRKEIESTVGVRALQRFASATALESESFSEDSLPNNGKSVGIVGAGPSGLSSAYYLARTGYDVTVYEAEKHVGGMLAFGVPQYRLPYEDIVKEVRTIEALGVKIKTQTRIGKDLSFESLQENHDAILLASGCHVGNTLPDFDHSRIETAAAFLRQVRLENRTTIGNRVLVVGGGDVAMDALRTAIRLGSEEVYLASLEAYHEMPASLEERVQAKEENAQFLNGWGIKSLTFGDEIGVQLQACTRVFDDSYGFSPTFDSSHVKDILVDTLILAIGQKPNLQYLPESIDRKRGLLATQLNSFETNLSGVFAVGDVTKPSIAIEAIADGKIAARQIDAHLGGNGLYVGKTIIIPETPLSITTWDDHLSEEKQLSRVERSDNFNEISQMYDLEVAKREASRCLRCDRNSRKPLLLTPQRK